MQFLIQQLSVRAMTTGIRGEALLPGRGASIWTGAYTSMVVLNDGNTSSRNTTRSNRESFAKKNLSFEQDG